MEELLKISEQQLMNIIVPLSDAIFAVDIKGRVIWNKAVETMTGFQRDNADKINDEHALPFI